MVNSRKHVGFVVFDVYACEAGDQVEPKARIGGFGEDLKNGLIFFQLIILHKFTNLILLSFNFPFVHSTPLIYFEFKY